MSIRNSFGAVEGSGALLVAGKVTGGTGALTQLSGPLAQQSTISCSRTGTGAYTLTLNPFKGPLGALVPLLTPGAADIVARVNTATYTGDSVAITITTRTVAAGPAAADSDFYFAVFGF